MSSPEPTSSPEPGSALISEGDGVFSQKNMLIIILVGLLVLSFIGVNLLAVSGNIMEDLSQLVGPVFRRVASMLGYSSGELVNTTADVVGDTAKLGVDIAQGAAKDIGNLLKDASKGGMDAKQRRSLNQSLKSVHCASGAPAEPDSSGSDIQKTAKGKGGWCLTGEYNGARGCVAMDDHSKCMSGQVFPSQKMCLRPH